MRTFRNVLLPGMTLIALGLPACVRVEPIEVKPIHIVMDINIKIDRELDQFFDFEKSVDAPATQPASGAPGEKGTQS